MKFIDIPFTNTVFKRKKSYYVKIRLGVMVVLRKVVKEHGVFIDSGINPVLYTNDPYKQFMIVGELQG